MKKECASLMCSKSLRNKIGSARVRSTRWMSRLAAEMTAERHEETAARRRGRVAAMKCAAARAIGEETDEEEVDRGCMVEI